MAHRLKNEGKVKRERPRQGKGLAEKALVLETLMKFRLVINSAKRHYAWVEKQCGVSGAQMWLLWELSESPGMRASDLASTMAIHQSTVSNLLDRLESDGFITRDRSSQDRRVVTLYLTRSGGALVKRAPKPACGILPDALRRLDPKDLQSLESHLAKLIGVMNSVDLTSLKKPLADTFEGKPR
jgi:DNA-binding MarR family transcriptional regulator